MDDFEAMYRRRAHSLFVFFLQSTGRADVAEDLAAEVFLRVARARPQFAHDGAEGRWFQVTRDRILLDWRRHQARDRTVAGERAPGDEPVLPDSAPPLLEALWIKELVGRLTPEQAEVVALHFEADLPLTEVASRLGITPDAARARLHRALYQMRAWIADESEAASADEKPPNPGRRITSRER